MHQFGLCLCPSCIAQISVHEDETRTRAQVRIASCKRKGEHGDRVADGVVKRAAPRTRAAS